MAGSVPLKRLLARSLAIAVVGLSALTADGDASARDRCPNPPRRDAEALTLARACIVSLEAELGPDAPLIQAELTRLGQWFSGAAHTAGGARYFQRRALRLAQTRHGARSLDAAGSALALAQSTILSGRCAGPDPEVLTLLTAAVDGYQTLDVADPSRRRGLAAAARAYADLLEFQTAATLLADAGPAGVSEWEMLGDWRRRIGETDGAVDAWLRGADLSGSQSAARARMMRSARKAAFEAGDRSVLEKLENHQKSVRE